MKKLQHEKLVDRNELVIGWRVARDLGVEWYDHSNAASHGDQPDHVLETVSASTVATHTAIVAQSGSGKSFFLGRYVEEVLLRTRAQVTIFDPNADFRRIGTPNPTIWKKHDDEGHVCEPWNPKGKSRDPLPHERRYEDFAAPWEKIRKRVAGKRPESDPNSPIQDVKFHWCSLRPSYLLVGESDIYDPIEFIALHEYVIAGEALWDNLVASRAASPQVARWNITDWLEHARSKKGKGDIDAAEETIKKIEQAIGGASQVAANAEEQTALMSEFIRAFKMAARAQTETRTSYIKKNQQFAQRGRLADGFSAMSDAFGLDYGTTDVRVLDLPSFDDPEDRDLSVLFLLDTIWHDARKNWEVATRDAKANEDRVPHLIVLDEAHNLVPAEGVGSTLTPIKAEIRDRIKTIAGEGRKYGLVLVVVTQRPDKLDAQVLSECGNQALMLIRSQAVLHDCRKLLGVELGEDDCATIHRDFGSGYVRLSGRWSTPPRIIFAAARRTAPGGVDLDQKWTTTRDVVRSALDGVELESEKKLLKDAKNAPSEPDQSNTLGEGAPLPIVSVIRTSEETMT